MEFGSPSHLAQLYTELHPLKLKTTHSYCAEWILRWCGHEIFNLPRRKSCRITEYMYMSSFYFMYSGCLPVGFNCVSWHTLSQHKAKNHWICRKIPQTVKPRKLIIWHQMNSLVLLSLPPPCSCKNYTCFYFHYRVFWLILYDLFSWWIISWDDTFRADFHTLWCSGAKPGLEKSLLLLQHVEKKMWESLNIFLSSFAKVLLK